MGSKPLFLDYPGGDEGLWCFVKDSWASSWDMHFESWLCWWLATRPQQMILLAPDRESSSLRVCLLQSSAFEMKSPRICVRMPDAERRGPGMLDPLHGQRLGHRYAEVIRCSPGPFIMLMLWSACDYQFPVCLLSINQARLWRGNFICSLKKNYFLWQTCTRHGSKCWRCSINEK